MTTASDLVPQAVFIRIADRIANSARQFARQVGSKRIPKAIKVGRVNATESTLSISISLDTSIAPQAAAFEHGAKPHPIPIYTHNAPFLVFEGTNQFAGQTIVTPSVNHPGIEPRPFVKPAVANNKEWALGQIREAVGHNLRLSVRAMARKV